MNIREIREMTDDEILNTIEDKKEAMFNLRFQAASGQMEDTNGPRYARRDLAQLKTVLGERQRAIQNTGKAN